MGAQMMLIAMLVVFLIPLAWTGAVSAMRAMETGRSENAPLDDGIEKIILAIMLAPSALGVMFMAWAMAPQPYAPPPMASFDVDFFHVAGAVSAAGENAAAPAFDWTGAAAWSFVLAYACGFEWRAFLLAGTQVRLARIARAAADASALWGEGVALTDACVSPFLAGDGRVILPRTLVAKLAPGQIDLIIAHERAHQRRGDGRYYVLLAWIAVAFWFNPFVLGQTRRCRLGAEIACDGAVTGDAPTMRRAYAQALVSALKHAAGDALPCAPAAFSTRSFGEHRMRIAQIMQSVSDARKRRPWAVFVAAALLAAPVGALQLAYAQPDAPREVAATAPVRSASPEEAARLFSFFPLEGESFSAYGQRSDPFTGAPAFHRGVDFRAPEGTPIVAPAGGRVARAETQGGYGKLLEIDHGGGVVTRYAHLSAFEVREGQEVAAGQLIARVGQTGRSTIPHLHLEVWRNGETVDPAQVLPARAAQ